MESKLLLIKAITLLFKEALIKDASARSISLVNAVVATVKVADTGSEFGSVRERLLELKKTATWMTNSTTSGPFDRAGVLQRIRVASGEDDSIYAAFEVGIGDDNEKPEHILKQCQGIIAELHEHLDNEKFTELARTMYMKAAFGKGPAVGTREFIRECSKVLGDLGKGGVKQIKGMVDEIYFDNEESTIDIMTRAKEALSTDGALKFGQTALNEACYDHPGALRGEFWLVSALSHNFKTGFGLTTFVDLALYNSPWMLDLAKKPLIMHISTEDSAEKNAMQVYKMLIERETGELCDMSMVDPTVAAHYVKERLSVNGYHTYMCRVDPGDTTNADIQTLIEQKEADGYEVHALVFDYPDMLDTAGLIASTNGAEKRDRLRRLRNFFSKRKTFCMVFHQLGPTAQQLERQGIEDLVKVVAGKGHYDGCTKLFHEVDVDITLHIEKVGEKFYLSMQWAKHRKLTRTPKSNWYAAMLMSDVGGLVPDVGKEPRFVRDLKPLRQANGSGDWFSKGL